MDQVTVTIGKREGADKWETIFGPEVSPADQLTNARDLRGKDGWRRLVVLTNKTARWRWSGGAGLRDGVKVKERRNPDRCKVEELLGKIHASKVLEAEIDDDPALSSAEKYQRVKNVRAARKALEQCLKDLRASLAEKALVGSAESVAKKRAATKAAPAKNRPPRKRKARVKKDDPKAAAPEESDGKVEDLKLGEG